METWRQITTWGAPPEFNMGLDGALLEDVDAPPTLRFYTWTPAALSLGYFQRFDDVPAASDAFVVVRRVTGGGAIHHANELTFSITASAKHSLFQGPIPRSYERIHELIAQALSRFGCDPAMRGDSELSSDISDTGMCFHHSTSLDLAWGGRKGVGSAQRRRRERVLHHGSIKLGPSQYDTGVAELEGSTDPAELARVIAEVFRESAKIQLTAGVPSPSERESAALHGQKSLDPDFIKRR
jgi:lipoate-protein ligase A